MPLEQTKNSRLGQFAPLDERKLGLLDQAIEERRDKARVTSSEAGIVAQKQREKGPGFLGTLKRPDGKVSTELSIGVDFDGKETEIPSLVPTLTKAEIDHLLSGKKPTSAIKDKAVEHAIGRIRQEKSPFYQEDEKNGTRKPSEYQDKAGLSSSEQFELIRQVKAERKERKVPKQRALSTRHLEILDQAIAERKEREVPVEIPERTLAGTLKDIAVTAGKGVVGLGEAAVGLADIPTFGRVGREMEEYLDYKPKETQEFLSSLYSPAQKAITQEVESAKGFRGKIKTMLKHPSTIGHAVLESTPQMLGGAGIARTIITKGLLKISPLLAGAIGEGLVSAGGAAETIRQQTEDGLLTPKQTLLPAISGAGTALFGVVGGRIAKKMGIVDVDTFLAGSSNVTDVGVIKRIIGGGISEGMFEELPQSMQEQVWLNAALDKPLLEGVSDAAATGILVGAAMGAGFNIFTGKAIPPKDATPEETRSFKENQAEIERQWTEIEEEFRRTPEGRQELIEAEMPEAPEAPMTTISEETTAIAGMEPERAKRRIEAFGRIPERGEIIGEERVEPELVTPEGLPLELARREEQIQIVLAKPPFERTAEDKLLLQELERIEGAIRPAPPSPMRAFGMRSREMIALEEAAMERARQEEVDIQRIREFKRLPERGIVIGEERPPARKIVTPRERPIAEVRTEEDLMAALAKEPFDRTAEEVALIKRYARIEGVIEPTPTPMRAFGMRRVEPTPAEFTAEVAREPVGVEKEPVKFMGMQKIGDETFPLFEATTGELKGGQVDYDVARHEIVNVAEYEKAIKIEEVKEPVKEVVPEKVEVGVIQAVEKRGVKGDDLLNVADLIDEAKSYDKAVKIDADGYITLYHRTSKESADKIKESGYMTTKEPGLYFGSKPKGQISGYGDSVIKVKIPIEKVRINDIFTNEVHFNLPEAMPGTKYKIEVVEKPAKPLPPKPSEAKPPEPHREEIKPEVIPEVKPKVEKVPVEKKEYFITTPEGKQKIKGKPIKIKGFEKYDLFYSKREDQFNISEMTTGLSLATDKTLKGAKQKAFDLLTERKGEIDKVLKEKPKVEDIEEIPTIKETKDRLIKNIKDEKGESALITDLSTLGADAIRRGHESFKAFSVQMESTLSEVWDKIKHLMQKAYDAAKVVIKSERGEIVLREPKIKKLTAAEKMLGLRKIAEKVAPKPIPEKVPELRKEPTPIEEAFKVLGIKPKLKPGESLPKRARSVGLAYQKISEEAKRLEVEMGLEYPKVTRTHADLRKQADRIMGDQEQLLKTMIKEKNFTEAEGLVIRRSAVSGLETLMKVVATENVEKANEMHKTFKEGMGHRLQDLHNEFGRNLESLKEKVGPESIAKAFANLERKLSKEDIDRFNTAAEALGQGNAKPMINFQKYLKTTKADPAIMDYVYEYWYNSILSGIPTHVVNVASNTAWAAWQIVVHKPILTAIDPLVAKFQKRPTEYYLDEIIPALAGIKKGLKPGLRGAKEVIIKGYTTNAEMDKFAVDMGKSVGAFARSPNKHLRMIAPVISFPTRTLRSMDIWAKQMNFQAELGAIAKRMEKKGEGKYEDLLKNPTEAMMNQASEYADYATFMNRLGTIGTRIEKLRGDVPGGRFIVPFVRTIANLVKRGVEMTPGVGALKFLGQKVTGPEVSQILAKQVEGAMIALVVAFMFLDDEITGDAPANKAEREAFYRQGKKPWAIKIGNRWFQYRRVEPFNTPIASVGILYDTWKRTGKELSTEFAWRATAGFVNNVIDSSYLSGLTNVLDSVRKADKWPQKLTNMFDRIIASFSPMSSFQRSFVRAIEAIEKDGAILRKPKGPIETVLAATPFASKLVSARKNVWGEDVVIPGTPIEQWLPWKTAKVTTDVVEKEIERLHDAGLLGYPGMPSKYISIKGKRIDLDNEQYDILVIEGGKAAKKKLDNLIGTHYWKTLSNKEKASRIQRIIRDSRKKSRNKLKRQLGDKPIPGMVPWKKKKPAWQKTVFGKKPTWQKSVF